MSVEPSPEAYGARCAAHIDRAAVAACARCGTFGCAECIRVGESGRPMCAQCEPYSGPGIPWESRAELGAWRAFVDTTKLVTLSPSRFYAIPPRERSPWGALLYGFAFVFVTSGLSLAYNTTIGAAQFESQLAQSTDLLRQSFPSAGAFIASVMRGVSVISFLCSPFQYIMNLVIGAALTWLGLKITGNLRSSFVRLLSGLAYMSWVNALALLMLTGQPFAVGIVGFAMIALFAVQWTILVRQSQRITTAQAVWSSLVVTAIVFSLCCVFVVLPVVGLAIASTGLLGR